MAISFNLNGLSWVTINAGSAVTMPVLAASYSPKLGVEPFRSGGDINPSMMRRAGAQPAFIVTVPLSTAWAALGQFLPVAVTALSMYQASFTGSPALRVGTAAEVLSLTATTGKAYARITRIYAVGAPVPMMAADIEIALSATDGLTDPMTISSASLPAAPSNPILHTLGPVVDNTTAKWGSSDWSIDTGLQMEPLQFDGCFYPTDYRMGAISARAVIRHVDVVAMMANVGDNGEDATGAGFLLYARAYDAASKVLQTTGYSFTFLKAMARLETITASGTNKSEVALSLESYAAAGSLTYPITVATSATLPT